MLASILVIMSAIGSLGASPAPCNTRSSRAAEKGGNSHTGKSEEFYFSGEF